MFPRECAFPESDVGLNESSRVGFGGSACQLSSIEGTKKGGMIKALREQHDGSFHLIALVQVTTAKILLGRVAPKDLIGLEVVANCPTEILVRGLPPIFTLIGRMLANALGHSLYLIDVEFSLQILPKLTRNSGQALLAAALLKVPAILPYIAEKT